MPKEELKVLRERMEKVIEHLKGEFLAIRTGRAHPGLVSDIKVDYYGAPTPIKQIATISVPEGRQIAISPSTGPFSSLSRRPYWLHPWGYAPE